MSHFATQTRTWKIFLKRWWEIFLHVIENMKISGVTTLVVVEMSQGVKYSIETSSIDTGVETNS